MTAQTQPETRFTETRWTAGAWLTLALALLWPVWWLGLTLVSYTFPSDGWLSRFPNFDLTANLTTEPSALQVGDHVLAINGQPVGFARQAPPIPAGLQAGQHLRYTVLRKTNTHPEGEKLEVDVVIRQLPWSAFFTYVSYELTTGAFDKLVSLFSLSLAIFVFFRRPGSHAARYMLLIFSWFAGLLQGHPALYVYSYPLPWNFLGVMQTVTIFIYFLPTLILFLLTFPALKWPLRRFPRALPLVIYGLPLVMIVPDIWLQVTGQTYGDGGWINVIPGVTFGGFVLTLFATQIHNWFTMRDPLTRAQLQWVTFGLGVGLGLGLLITFLSGVAGRTDTNFGLQTIGSVLRSLFPLSLAIAILRYRLFDIDLIIRRTLQYSLLSGLLALVYFGGIVVLQGIFTTLTGAESPIALVASTLAIAALFLPLRRRVQDFIDKRFYRRKYNAAKVIADFAATARDETDLDALTARLVEVVDETMQPESVSLWLKTDGTKQP